MEAVYNHKNIGSGEFILKAGVQDIERGVMEGISPYPWQTDTSNGDWYYNDNHGYKSSAQVIHMLTDIVSKNGNLLLNIVQYPDGSLPPESQLLLKEMAAWIKVNGEAIYATRPWKIYGEGPTAAAAGHFKEEDNYTAQDIRFTTKNNVLYATTLAEPSGQIKILSLGTNSKLLDKKIKDVHMLGYNKKLEWRQESDHLLVILPEKLPTPFGSSLKISF